MIAAWMLYGILCALGLSAAAALAERTLLSGRSAVRFVWIAAVGLSLLVPIAAFQFAPQSVAAVATAPIGSDVPASHVVDLTAADPTTPVDSRPVPIPGRQWGAILARWDAPLAIAWLVLSIAVAINLAAGVVALAWMRRRWRQHTVLNVPVFVSEHTGPAVVGVISPAIVVPEWVLALEPIHLSLLLRHEQEHRRAGDGRLLTAAQLALIVMPWNVALWWQILRLRVAVELDCDARVLRNADVRSYGNLLLEVARPRSGPHFMGATAFAERATQLERRIRVLSRHRAGTSRTARVAAATIGLIAVTAAWVAPHPPVPARAAASLVGPQNAAPEPASLERPPEKADILGYATKTADSLTRATRSNSARAQRPVAAPRSTGRDTALGTAVPPRSEPISDSAVQGRGTQGTQPRVDTIFARLFEGIALTPEQAARARDMLARLQQQQILEDMMTSAALLQKQAKALTARLQRDSALRALLTNEADRATFDARVARTRGGARSGGSGGESTFRFRSEARVGGGGGGGRGRGGGGDSVARLAGLRLDSFRLGAGRARRGDSVVRLTGFRLDSLLVLRADRDSAARAAGRGGRGARLNPPADSMLRIAFSLDSLMTGMTFNRLFSGITLTADQESRARALIAQTQQDVQGGRMPPPPPKLRMNPSGIVSMPAASADSLLLLLSNETDRAKLLSRMNRIP